MPKPKKGGGRGTVVKNLWDISEVQATPPSSHVRTAPTTAATYRHPRPVRHVSATVLKRAFMLQNFQFILRGDLLTITSTQGLPQGQRKLIECIQSSDSIVPWETVHSVVMRTTIDEFKCPICMEMPTAPRITECGHVYCLPCVLQYISRQKAASAPRTCPMCHDQLTLYTLRPCVLQLVAPLQVGSTVRFDLFKRQRNSCVLRRYDDSFLTAPPPPHVAGRPPIDLPRYKEPSASQSRYVMSTPAYEAQQRYSDGTGISERMRELELDGAAQPLTQSDAEVERFLLEALNEVTKEPKALAPSMVRNSPPLAPHPSTRTQAAEGDEDYLELYAEGEGQPFYLHMLTVKMLKHDAKLRGTALPDTVAGIVEEVVTMEQTEDTRHIYKVFSHVPLHGTIKLCVVNVDAMLLPETRAAFAAAVQRMVNERAHRRRRDDQMASEDASWKQYLQKYSGPQRGGGGGASSFSPDTAPSDFSIDTESLPYLQLPSSGSVGSDHGLPPNPLDTRQRATKRQDLQPFFVEDAGGGSVSGAGTGGRDGDTAAHSLLTPTTNTSSNTGGGCWAQGSAAKLFAKQERSSGVSSTWGGHAFRASP